MKRITEILLPLALLSCFFAGISVSGQGVVIEAGGTIEATGSANIEISDGSFTNNGTFTKGTDTIIFSGTSAGVIDGSSDTDFHDIKVSNSGGLTAQVNVTSNNTTVLSGASFDVAAGKKFEVAGILTNSSTDDGLVILSNDVANGELQVTGTASGNVTYQRYLTHSDWHLVSAPFAGMSINTYVTNAGNSIATNAAKYGLAPYDNSVPGWNHYNSSGDNLASAAGNFVSGKGYETLRATSSGTVDFVGTVVTEDVSIGVTQGSNSWNLIGNPFSTSLNGNDDAHATNNFLTVNTAALHDSYEAIYIWDPVAGYQTVNHVYASNTAFYLAPGQAFFVRSVDGGGTVDFTEALQSDVTGAFYKKDAKLEDFSISLQLDNGSKRVSTLFYYLENTSSGLDPGYDAGRFTGGDNSFAVYSHLVGDSTNKVDFDIQCLEFGDYSLEIPIGINANGGLDITISADIQFNVDEVPVLIEDRELGVFTDLQKDVYSVHLPDAEMGIGRFYLHNMSQTALFAELADDVLRLISAPSYGLLRILGEIGHKSKLTIYDVSGQMVYMQQLQYGSVNEVSMPSLNNGIYIAHIQNGMEYHTKKFVWIH